MNLLNSFFYALNSLLVKSVYAATPVPASGTVFQEIGIPTFQELITWLVRLFFFIAGLAALIFLILGALSWITSSGDKEKVETAQKKIQAAVIGLIVLVAVLSLVGVLEQIVFGGKICLGLTCPINIESFGSLLNL